MLRQKKQDLPFDLNRKMNVAYINLCTEAEGPYKRMAIWFQGCNLLCEGCCNPELQPISPAHIMTIKEIVDIAIESKGKNGIEGVTFLGGEPTLQSNIKYLISELKDRNIGTIMFTGRGLEEIDEEIVKNLDLIVDGRFDKNQIDTERNLVGSRNQKIINVTDRYKNIDSWFLNKRDKMVEINICQRESLLITGDML